MIPRADSVEPARQSELYNLRSERFSPNLGDSPVEFRDTSRARIMERGIVSMRDDAQVSQRAHLPNEMAFHT